MKNEMNCSHTQRKFIWIYAMHKLVNWKFSLIDQVSLPKLVFLSLLSNSANEKFKLKCSNIIVWYEYLQQQASCTGKKMCSLLVIIYHESFFVYTCLGVFYFFWVGIMQTMCFSFSTAMAICVSTKASCRLDKVKMFFF